ncbi:hypothetical protein EGY28_26285 [Burkholderia dolosa]|nr:hypothetical protein EGY28_26285 [Burkholderia dolosa]
MACRLIVCTLGSAGDERDWDDHHDDAQAGPIQDHSRRCREVSGIPCVRRVEIQTPMLNRSG